MNINFAEILAENIAVVVVLACLIIGYLIKHTTLLKKIPNGDIPAILAVIGAVLNAVVSGPSVETVVYGAFMGVASTGLHQIFKNFVENKKDTETVETNE